MGGQFLGLDQTGVADLQDDRNPATGRLDKGSGHGFALGCAEGNALACAAADVETGQFLADQKVHHRFDQP